MSDTKPFTITRGSGTVEFFLSDGDWVMRPQANEPEPEPEPEDPFERAWMGFMRVPIQRPKEWTVTQEQLFSYLTPDELRALLGYVTHVIEHGEPHLYYLHRAMKEALDARKFDVVSKLAEELHEALENSMKAGSTGVAVLELLDQLDRTTEI